MSGDINVKLNLSIIQILNGLGITQRTHAPYEIKVFSNLDSVTESKLIH